MTHIDRLLKSSPNPRTRELLGAALDDAPPRGSLARVAAGLGVVVGGSTWSAVAAGAGSATSATGAAVTPAGALTLLGAGKLLAIGALAGTLVSGAGVAIEYATVPSRSVRAPVTAAAPERKVHAASEAAGHGEASPSAKDANKTPMMAPHANPAPHVSTTPPSATRSVPKEASALAAEVARIDAARSALAREDAAQALSEIAAYRRERQLGVLDREAALLAIRAHWELGDVGRAQQLARGYLAEHPDDAHAPRLRELLGESERERDR